MTWDIFWFWFPWVAFSTWGIVMMIWVVMAAQMYTEAMMDHEWSDEEIDQRRKNNELAMIVAVIACM